MASLKFLRHYVVGVAQSVEHQIVVLDVAGSSPVTHPSLLRLTRDLFLEVIFIMSWQYSRGVAQLVAHSLWERGVVSSSLTTPTIFLPTFIQSVIYQQSGF